MPAPRKYDEETMARAVRMYRDRLAEGDVSRLAARQEVGEVLGVNQSTLRNWIRREDGAATGTAADGEEGETVEQQNARLRREVARLRRANEILKTSSAFFAAAELDRQLGNH
jgi:transposase